MQLLFRRFSILISDAVGSPLAFVVSVILILAWACTGPMFHYSDTWQLLINTGTTIVTFLMVFLIQYTQNRDTRMMHLKLDELLRAMEGARTGLVALDKLSDEDLAQLQDEFERLGRRERIQALREARRHAAHREDVDERGAGSV